MLPASAYLEMALAAAAEVFGARSDRAEGYRISQGAFPARGRNPHDSGDPLSGRGWSGILSHLQLRGRRGAAGRSWMLHATGKVCLQQDNGVTAPDAGQETLAEMRTRCAETISGQDYYRRLSESGIHYGPFFQSIARLWRNNGDMLGEVQVPDGPEADLHGLQIHPAILDAGLQVFGAAVAAEATETDRQGLYLPTRIDQFRVHGRSRPSSHGATLGCEHREAMPRPEKRGSSMKPDAWRSRFTALRFEYLGEDTQRAAVDNLDDWLYEFQWQPKERAAGEPAAPAGRASWLIFADSGGVGDALSALLEARGERSILVARRQNRTSKSDDSALSHPSRTTGRHKPAFRAALASDQPGCRGVIHLWSLDVARPEETTVASLNAAQTLGCGSVLLLVQELARIGIARPSSAMADYAGCSSGRRRAFPVGRRAVTAVGIGSRHCSGTPDLLGRAGGPGTRGITADDAAAHQLWRGNLQCRWRGSTRVSSRAAIRGPFGPPGAIGRASPPAPVADRRQLSDQRRLRRPRPLGRTVDGRARGAAVDPSGTHQAPAARELELGRNRKSPGPANRRHSGTGIVGSKRASGAGRCSAMKES